MRSQGLRCGCAAYWNAADAYLMGNVTPGDMRAIIQSQVGVWGAGLRAESESERVSGGWSKSQKARERRSERKSESESESQATGLTEARAWGRAQESGSAGGGLACIDLLNRMWDCKTKRRITAKQVSVYIIAYAGCVLIVI